jgi:hypothetical protein
MVTLFFCITIFETAAEGRFTGSPEGVIKEAVSIKKISNKNTMSVIEDMLKFASTLCLVLISITEALEVSQ